ncbi:MAG: response regulator [Kiritimatiellae bacterium]|nr:response regulator [Kiritimatiellia bacterium]
MKSSDGSLTDISRQSAFSRAVHSIRTRYSLSTAVFLLVLLALFYAGGRMVLVRLVRDTEAQVKELGSDMARIAYRDAERARSLIMAQVRDVETVPGGMSPRELVAPGGVLSLAVELSSAGEPGSGFYRNVQGVVTEIAPEQLAVYRETLVAWCRSIAAGQGGASAPVGLLRLAGQQHYVTLRRFGDGFLAVGVPFDAGEFARSMNDNRSGMAIRVTNRQVDVSPNAKTRAGERNGYGFSPLFSEAADFCSGGFWDLGASPFEAVFAVRDIAGNAVSMIAVSLPKTLDTVTTLAISRLTFFVALAGILVVLPIFWIQGRLLLNPLTRMTQAVRELGERHQADDCPHLEWSGKDEFAVLASSVNRMLETVSAKSVAIAQIERRHKALIDGLPDAVAVFDAQGRLVTMSKEAEGVGALPGFRTGEPPDAAVFGGPETARFAKVLSDTVATGGVGQVRLKVQRPAGVPRSVPTRHFELRITKMDELFVMAIIRDVSAEVAEHKLRLEAEKRALDSSKRESLTALAAGIAHDMNNVLSVVLQAAEAYGVGASPGLAPSVIRDAVRRGAAMMRELTAFAGENRMTLMRAHPGLVVEDVRQLASRLVGANIVLTMGADAAVPDVDVDPNQFWKVFFNIIKNAGEAIGTSPGHIDLRAVPFEMTRDDASDFVSEHPLGDGPGVLFCIKDDGPGISPDLLKRIFDPYVSSKAMGRGLGLATVRTIVEAHGGGIRVQSRLDEGTTFQIFLPASTLPENDSHKCSPAAEVASEGLSGDVLVVDNDEAILKTTAILLKALKLCPRTAHDRHEALAVVRRHATQLRAIILDAHLGGIDTVRLLRAFRIGVPQVPVIVSSGSSEDEIREMFRDHAYDAFLAKPYTLEELKRTVMTRRSQA